MTGVPPQEARAAAEKAPTGARRRSRTLSLDRIALTEDNRRWWTLAAMCFALFMVMLDNTVVNVALPAIQRDLHASISGLEWTVNAYTLTFGMLIVTGGRLGDLFGRRKMFLFGVGVFALSSAAIGLAPTDTALVVGRAIQGIGAAFMMPATLSIITNAFPPHERGKAIGTWAGVSAIALALGPVVGGALVEHVSWRAIFYLNLPVAVGALVITLYATKESRDETVEPSVDVAGVLLLSAGLGALVLALVEGNSWGWGSDRVIALFAGAAVSLIAFVAVERNARAPMLDFSYFRSRSFAGANIVAFIVSFAMLAMFFFMALYMQNVRGYTPLQAGLRFLPSTIVIMFIGPVAGRLADRIGPRPLMVGGLIAVSGSLLWQSFLDVDTSYSFLAGSFVLMGVGMGFVMSPMSTAAMNAVDRSKAGAASGVLSMSRMVGGTFGVAVLGALVTGLGRGRLDQLLPGVTPAQREHLADNLGSGATTQAVAPDVVRATKEAFVYAMSHGMRLGAGVALLGAAVASALVANRPGHEPAQASAERARHDTRPEPAHS